MNMVLRRSTFWHTFIFLGFSIGVSLSLKAQDIKKINWIVGDWEMIDGATTTSESWITLDDSTYIGTGLTLDNGVEVFRENLRIERRNNLIHYVAVLPQKTAIFNLKWLEEQAFSFEDPANDFPSTIVYELHQGKMEITLMGESNGEGQSIAMKLIRK